MQDVVQRLQLGAPHVFHGGLTPRYDRLLKLVEPCAAAPGARRSGVAPQDALHHAHERAKVFIRDKVDVAAGALFVQVRFCGV